MAGCVECGSGLEQPFPPHCPACRESAGRRRPSGPCRTGDARVGRRDDRVRRLRNALFLVMMLLRRGLGDEAHDVARAAL